MLQSLKYHADPKFLAPNDAAWKMQTIARQDQREFFRDANRACNVQRRTVVRYVANGAVYGAATELNRSSLEYPISMSSPFLDLDLTLRSLPEKPRPMGIKGRGQSGVGAFASSALGKILSQDS
jgi:hypothetical protein